MPNTDRDRLQTIRDRAQRARKADEAQITREREDLQVVAGEMWPKAMKDARAGSPAQGTRPAIAARPCLVVDKISPSVQQVLNQERASHMGISITAADDFQGLTGRASIDKQELELREGLVRRIQRHPSTKSARSWAFDRAVKCGRGYYRVLLRYVNDRSFDQEVYVERIWNQELVSLDPAHIEPDGRDTEWGFVFTWLTWEDYQRQYPEAKSTVGGMTSWADVVGYYGEMNAPEWLTSDGEPAICVAEYFYFDYETTKTLYQLEDGSATWDLPDGVTPKDERTVSVKTVKWCKVNGAEVLDEQDWSGKYIPIIKVVGNELQPYAGERRYQGMVRPATSSNQGLNYTLSKSVEAVALSPLAPFMATTDQIKGYERFYEMAAVMPLPYLPYNAVSVNGTQLEPPARNIVEPPIQALAMMTGQFNALIKDTTGVFDPSLGNIDPSIKSGRAILALKQSSEQGTSGYIDNLARSEEYEGAVVNDLLYGAYGTRPGRLVEIVDGQLKPQTAMIGGGNQPVPTNTPHPVYTLSEDGDFNVAIKVSRSFDTRRDETNATLGEIIGAHPEIFPVYADLYFDSLDSPQSDQLAERAKLMLPPQVQAAEQAKKQDPAQALVQLQGQAAKAQQLIDVLAQRVEQLTDIIKNETAKETAETQRTKMELDSKERVAQMQTMASFAATEAKISAQNALEFIKVERERIAQRIEDVHEMLMSRQDHEQQMQAGQQAHQQQMEAGEAGHGQALEQGEAAHAQGLETQEAAAELAPEPASGE